MIKITLFPFREKEFCKRIAKLTQHDNGTECLIKEKPHLKCLSAYLERIGAKTVIVENSYLDRDLVSDFWAFLPDAICNIEYYCIRLHFFEMPIEGSSLNEWSQNGRNWKALSKYLKKTEQANYLGYMVVLLSGDKVIGPTCLRAYCRNGKAERIPTLREYKVNLVGHKLSVRSLGFREQDRVTSACATCALWYVLQKSSIEHRHSAPSPGEIAARALGSSPLYLGNKLPEPERKGLSAAAMLAVIDSIPEVKAFVYNISRSRKQRENVKIPPIVGVLQFILPILDLGMPVIILVRSLTQKSAHSLHAITVVGYHHSRESNKERDIKTRAEEITSLIVHDDNRGPFMQYKIEDSIIVAPAEHGYNEKRWEIHSAICVTHKSIKIYPHDKIYTLLMKYRNMLLCGCYDFVKEKKIRHFKRMLCADWAIKIWKSNDYKNEICQLLNNCNSDKMDLHRIQMSSVIEGHLRKLLKSNLPEYIMVCSIRKDFEHDIIFSLAGPWETEMFILIVPFGEKLLEFFSTLSKDSLNDPMSAPKPSSPIYPNYTQILGYIEKYLYPP